MTTSRWQESISELRGQALWVALGCLICQMGLGLTYIRTGLAVDLIEGLSLTRAELSSAALPQLLFQALASPLVGFLTVRLGASRVLAVSATFLAFVFLGFSRIDSLSGLYIVIAGVGLGAAGMGDITVGHIVSQWFRRNRGLALGIAYAGSNLGGSVIVAIVTTVAAEHGWRAGLMAVVPIALCVLLPTALLLVRDPPADYKSGLERAAAAKSFADDEDGEVEQANDVDLRTALRTRSFWILTATLFTFFFYFTGILDHLVLFLVDTGVPKEEAIAAFRRAVGLGVASKILGGFFSDRIPQLRAAQAVYALLALSSLILLALPHPVLLTAFVLSFGFAQACRDVVYPLVLGRCFGDRYLGEIYGAMTLTLLPGGALGPIFAAVLHDRLGDYRIAFGTFAVLNGLALLGLLFVRDERRPIAG
jgi:sugar phosphate permease